MTMERDISGARVVITGATNGIGKAWARDLIRRGADLTIIARDRAKAEAVAAELAAEPGARGKPDVVLADLSVLSDVRHAAAEIHQRLDRIDVLANNAGLTLTRSRTTPEGLDYMMATNHFGPFLLTNLLLDLLTATPGARVITTASEAHRSASRPQPDALGGPADYGPVGGQFQYGRTKLLNILFTQELARRLADSGVTANCFCPGPVASGFTRESRLADRGARALSRVGLVRTPQQGARMGIRLTLDPELAGITGRFFTSTPGMRLLPPVRSRSDLDYQRALWERSAEIVGV
ncbi:SDR family NAD(P)-dependent oxidoreductase [Nocardia sp. NPDC004722]